VASAFAKDSRAAIESAVNRSANAAQEWPTASRGGRCTYCGDLRPTSDALTIAQNARSSAASRIPLSC